MSSDRWCVVSVAGVMALGGCAGQRGGASGCLEAAVDEPGEPASFRVDVLPVFQRSCGLSGSCHGTESPAAANQPYLGPSTMEEATAGQIDAIQRQIVGVASVAEPSLSLVEPGLPSKSFLLYKLQMGVDGAACAELSCAADDSCGEAMPLNGGGLGEGEREVIRRWIALGANND